MDKDKRVIEFWDDPKNRKRVMVFFADDPIGTIWKVAVTFAAIAAIGVLLGSLDRLIGI